MTKIVKLEMKGFKSFALKTEMPFGNHFNVILGPNGSGKSNVLDALCFVLGKSSAKSLRAEKSANLIYNGGKKKKPAKHGEVSIYFDNSKKIFPVETLQVKITRIIKHTGQSTYKINDEKRTRQQILDFLSIARINPDGYNIILQGDIVHLVEMSLIERRQIIEEIAGISVYEDKKEKALRELSRVEEKLNEADIILIERKGFLRELKKERNQALKFKELDINIKRNRATMLSKQIKEKNDKKKELEKEVNKNNQEIESLQKKVDALKDKIAEKKEEIDAINREVEEKGEKEQVELHREIEKIKVDFALNKQRIETLKQEISKIDDRKEELEKNKDGIDGKINILNKSKEDAEKAIAQKESELRKINAKLEEFKNKNKLGDAQELDKTIEDIDSRAEEIQDEINKLREEQQTLFRDKDKYEIMLQSLGDKIEKVLIIEKENKEAVDNLKENKQKFKEATSELNTRLADESSIAPQLDNARSKLLSRKEELSRLNIRTAGLREQLAGNRGIKAVLDKNFPGVHGLVSQLGNVSTKHSLALGIAAGNRIKSIVVDNDETASKCIKYLKENKLGTATFLPLNKLKSPLIKTEFRSMKSSGIIGMAIDLVKYEPKYEKVFQYVFGNTLVVENIDVARRIGIGRVRMVTVSGDLIETSGAMQGGYRERTPEMSFREEEVAEQINELESEVKDLESVISKLEAKKKENDSKISELRSLKAELEAEILKTERSLHLESEDLDATKDEKKKFRSEIESLEDRTEEITSLISERNKELAGLKSEKQMLREKMTEMRSPALLAEINTFEQKKQELRDEISELKGERKSNESEANNILLPEHENIDKILKQQVKEKEEFEKEKKELEAVVKQQTKELADKEKKEKKFYSQYRDLYNKRAKLGNEVSKAENTLSNRQDDIRRVEQRNNNLSLEKAKIVGELEGLEEEFKQFEGIPVFKNKSDEEIMREIHQFEKMVEDIGAVNMKALEIYDKAEIEYENLLQKKEKLGSEREDILVMINEIDSKKKELFMKTFEVLNNNFQKIFGTLSTKGDAFMEIEDEKDPFVGGVELKVRITGRKFMDIRSLSGGEKTLTALSFIFAVQEHEPASFYILDEVDASLDKKNSEKLAGLIIDYSKKAQYVIISHNDGVITAAENLYGISMNQHGISKVTSLKI
ncbi:MAG: chromosome segregation protein SMC [Nanoarchaeota archaeon]|nr:chromosome segregation protein SMC [DPANN group archaeon]MBL7116250.1 chromosome segregation protein SMC [Nanoarchaeota archaeon]